VGLPAVSLVSGWDFLAGGQKAANWQLLVLHCQYWAYDRSHLRVSWFIKKP